MFQDMPRPIQGGETDFIVKRGKFIGLDSSNISQFDCGIVDPNMIIATETVTGNSHGWTAIYIKNGLGQYPSNLTENGLFNDNSSSPMNQYAPRISVNGSIVTISDFGYLGREIEWIAYKNIE